MEKNKLINIGGKEYKFELDRKHIILAEENFGVSLVKIEEQIISQSMKIWAAGLQKHHNKLSLDERYDLYEAYRDEGEDVMEVITFLIEQISNFLQPTQKKK